MTDTLFDLPTQEKGRRTEETQWGVRCTRTVPGIITAGHIDQYLGEGSEERARITVEHNTGLELVRRTVVSHTTRWETA